MSQGTSDLVDIQPGAYHDSVTLMLLSDTLMDDPLIDHAIVAMGTALNLELLADAGYQLPDVSAGDLIIACRCAADSVDHARTLVDRLLADSGRRGGASGPSEDSPARTLRTALSGGAGGSVNVALISVPGPHAFRLAMEAIESGVHPIVFSDNVSVDHEVVLKRAATEAGLVAMGPDCGTVILDGVGLGFANVVTPGPVGLVSASGTGAQEVCALCDAAGIGVRHVVGLGGRDLSDEIGGLSAFPALRLLDDDPRVEIIGLVAKHIGPNTGRALDEVLAQLATPTVFIPGDDLSTGASMLLAAVSSEPAAVAQWTPTDSRPSRPGRLLGLFSGGTLAGEAARLASEAGVSAEMLDLGDDAFTAGRPHPMIDYRLRLERLAAADHDPDVGVVLLDVVLGHGSAADPASELVPVLAQLQVPVYISLVGTEGDPQGRDRQGDALAAAGAAVLGSNAAAARAAIEAMMS